MECKSLQTDDVVITGIRINRYIMECKLPALQKSLYLHPRINRYIMECKFCNRISSRTQSLELIDTLWNVNDNEIWGFLTYQNELIDTLWNVN